MHQVLTHEDGPTAPRHTYFAPSSFIGDHNSELP